MKENLIFCQTILSMEKNLIDIDVAISNKTMPTETAPHLAWRAKPPGLSRVAAGALDLRRGPQGPALVASGKASPHASSSGAFRNSSPADAGA